MNALSGPISWSAASITISNSRIRSGESVRSLQGLRDLGRLGRREVPAEGEEVALDRLEQRVGQVGGRGGAREADCRVQLVHVAVRGDARVVLRHPAATEKAGGAGIAGAGVDGHGL